MPIGIWLATLGWGTEAGDPVEHATWAARRTVPTTKSYPAPNVRSANKPCFVLKTSSGVDGWISHPIQELHEDTEREGIDQPFSPARGCFSTQPWGDDSSPTLDRSHTLQRSWPQSQAKVEKCHSSQWGNDYREQPPSWVYSNAQMQLLVTNKPPQNRTI